MRRKFSHQGFRISQYKGFSLVEIILVMGMIAAVAIGAFLIYPSVRYARLAVGEQANLQHITGATKHTFLLSGYLNLTNDLANNAMVFPKNMNENNYQAGQEITSTWGGPVTIGPSTQVPGLFRVVYEDVPERVCVEFSRGIAMTYERVLINEVAIKDMIDGIIIDPSVTTITQLCDTEDPITIRVETR